MRVTIGRIGRPHGVLGEMTVEVRTDEPDQLFVVGVNVWVGDRVMTITNFRWHNQRGLLRLDGIDDRDDAESLRDLLIEVERADDAVPAEEDTFYDASLVHCSVEDGTGQLVGVVTDVVHVPGQDLLVVTTAQGREIFIPFVASIVPIVDVTARRIVIDPPPGLLESEDAH
jgi:16S rRNA processing protein RimM